MRPHIRLGRLFGIDIGLHYTWFIVALLIGVSLAGHFRELYPTWGDGLVYGLSFATAALFFASLLVHELSHALVATRNGLRVRSVVLFALGGVAQIEGDAPTAGTELRMGIVGPLVSASLGALFLGLARLAGWDAATEPTTPVPAMLVWLGYINIMLAVFNMLPAFPLDGGRVLRALMWWWSGDGAKATRRASRSGQVLAWLLIMFGLSVFLLTGAFGGLWLGLIGWFLLEAARESYVLVAVRQTLRDVRVGDLMRPSWPEVDADLRLDRFVYEQLLHGGARTYAVTRGDRVEGLITPDEVRKVEQPLWTRITVEQVMQPLEMLPTVAPDQPALDAVERMAREDLEELPVVEQGHIRGLFTRATVLEYLHRRNELHV